MASWRHCSSCRGEIGFEETYWVCSVSTCARVARTGLFFCSVGCWEAHLPTMRHREAWAVEKRAPSEGAWKRQLEAEREAEVEAAASGSSGGSGARSPSSGSAPSSSSSSSSASTAASSVAPRRVVAAAGSERVPAELAGDVLVVVSKLKKYIRARSGMNTSDGVTSVLSDHLRRLCDAAARHAAEDGRKTVLDRDFEAILR